MSPAGHATTNPEPASAGDTEQSDQSSLPFRRQRVGYRVAFTPSGPCFPGRCNSRTNAAGFGALAKYWLALYDPVSIPLIEAIDNNRSLGQSGAVYGQGYCVLASQLRRVSHDLGRRAVLLHKPGVVSAFILLVPPLARLSYANLVNRSGGFSSGGRVGGPVHVNTHRCRMGSAVSFCD